MPLKTTTIGSFPKPNYVPITDWFQQQGGLNHIDKNRLWAGPDCGLAMLGHDLAIIKMKNLCEAAKLV